MTEETQALALQIVKALDGSDSGAVCFDAYNDVAYLDTKEAVALIAPILAAALTTLARDLETARQERDAALKQRNAFDRECKRLRAAAREGQ